MEHLQKLYQTLIEAYTEQVKSLELQKKEVEDQVGHQIQWIPYMALNSRMFTYDEYLTNIHHSGFCYKEKNKVMPHLIKFIASYKKKSEEDRLSFEEKKIKNEYQKHLDSLYLDKIDFIKFQQAQLSELRKLEYENKAPHYPSKKNAIRQLAKYKEDKIKYEKNLKSINSCIKEVEDRIKLFEELLKT